MNRGNGPRVALLVAALAATIWTTGVVAGDAWLDDEAGPPAQAALVAQAPMAIKPQRFGWMHRDVKSAWQAGHLGQGVSVTVVDDFFLEQDALYLGLLDDSVTIGPRGYFTRKQIDMIAPLAFIRSQDYIDRQDHAVRLASGLNVINVSYGVCSCAPPEHTVQDASIIDHAHKGRAVVVKAAGNDGVAVNGRNGWDEKDYLNIDLIGAKSVIFVGALQRHGTTAAPAHLADYSNVAGKRKKVRKHFLVVGVTEHKTGLAGTDFAAPIVSGYAAIVGSKFPDARPNQIVRQLLTTARTDTIFNYKKSVHGRGEACLSCALAPRKIK